MNALHEPAGRQDPVDIAQCPVHTIAEHVEKAKARQFGNRLLGVSWIAISSPGGTP
jgi:hypothetical protein